MAVSNTNIGLISLDPNTLKQNFITWLQTQSIFRDYNFAGSNLNVELDVLARNDFLMAFYYNMVFSEGFIDSAQLRDSLVSKAKGFGYIPGSIKSSTTSINISFQTSGITTFEMPKGTSFIGTNANGTFYFVTDRNYVAISTNNTFSFSNVNIYEGLYQNDLYSVDTTVNNQLFTLSNQNSDISSLSVVVSEDSGSSNTLFQQVDSLLGLNGNSEVYFVQGASNNTYQFYFGNGVNGYEPQNGAVVIANYRVASGNSADGISSFIINGNLGPQNGGTVQNVTVSSSGPSSGGSPAESIDSIRFNTPLHYQTQERAITESDYEILVKENFPFVKDCVAYSGGISNTGVTFGQVFLACITQNGTSLTEANKNDIISFISRKNTIGMPVNLIDPDILWIDVNTKVHVDFTQTTLSIEDYETHVANAIFSFSQNNLERFNAPFRFSKFGDTIDGVDTSILSNETSINLKRFANLTLNTNTFISLSFDNPILSVNTSQYQMGSNAYFITDQAPGQNTSGILYQIQVLANNALVNPTSIGTVAYGTGAISIPNIQISSLGSNAGFQFIALPANKDIYPIGNDTLEIDTEASVNISIVSG